MVFVDLKKAFDRDSREVNWWALRKKGVKEIAVFSLSENVQKFKKVVRILRMNNQNNPK